jgi:hypothetical protein
MSSVAGCGLVSDDRAHARLLAAVLLVLGRWWFCVFAMIGFKVLVPAV